MIILLMMEMWDEKSAIQRNIKPPAVDHSKTGLWGLVNDWRYSFFLHLH